MTVKSPSRVLRWPLWKTQTSAPKAALRLIVLRSTALTGTTTLPVIRKSSAPVTPIIAISAYGSLLPRVSWVSTSSAAPPPTLTGKDTWVARMSRTSCWLSGDTSSTEGTTER